MENVRFGKHIMSYTERIWNGIAVALEVCLNEPPILPEIIYIFEQKRAGARTKDVDVRYFVYL